MDYSKLWARFADGWELRSVASFIIVYLFGEYSAALAALFVLWLLDWATKWYVISRQVGSFRQAWVTDAISSRGMRDGLNKTIWYIIFLIVAHQLEQFSILGYSLGRSPTEVAAAYLALIEAKSILENLRDAGWENSGPLLTVLGRRQEQIAGQIAGTQQPGITPINHGLITPPANLNPREGETNKNEIRQPISKI